MTLPITMTASGPVVQSPTAVNAAIIAEAQLLVPDITTALPASLMEDLSSTGTAIAIVCDQAVVDSINNLTPIAANLYTLNQLGAIYGVTQGGITNASVYVTFSGTVGFPIPVGFTVSDGSYQYVVQDGGIIGSSGASLPLYCVATISGTWAIPPLTVTGIATSLPAGVSVTCTNSAAGIPGQPVESPDSYRARVLIAGQSIVQGSTTAIKTAINAIPNVNSRLVSVAQGGGFKIIVGGGDPVQVAGAIFRTAGNVSTLVGSVLSVTAMTYTGTGPWTWTVTTSQAHGLVVGNVITMTGVNGLTGINGVPVTVVTVPTATTFTFTVTGTNLSGSYASGGVITPNPRNITIAVPDYPDTYQITFVNPPQQSVSVQITWNTNSLNFVSPVAISGAAIPAMVSYINSIPVGQPINLLAMQTAFQESVAPLVSAANLTKLAINVYINSVLTAPTTGTSIIQGDPESYFYTTSASITVSQG